MKHVPRLAIEIAARREARGWTQPELSERLCVDVTTIARYERGLARPKRAEVLAALKTHLGFSQTDLDRLFLDWLQATSRGGREAVVRDARILMDFDLDEYELIERLNDIDLRAIPEMTESELGQVDYWARLFHASPTTWRVLSLGDVIVGYWHFIVLQPDTARRLRDGRFVETNLALEDIRLPKAILPPARVDIYVSGFSIDLPFQTPAMTHLLLGSLIAAIGDLETAGVTVQRVYADALTPASMQLALAMGFAPVHGGARLLVLDRHPPDVPSRIVNFA